MEIHVSHCMAKAYACRTHGKPCVWHMAGHVSSCMAMLRPINIRLGGGGSKFSSWGSSKGKEEEGKRERKERRRKGGKERRKGGKEKKRIEEKRKRKGRKREKRKRKRKECCAVSRPGRQRTRNCATRGRFPPTLIILRLGAV